MLLSYEKCEEEGEFLVRFNWVVLEGVVLYFSEVECDILVVNYCLDYSVMVYLEVIVYNIFLLFRGGCFDWLVNIDIYGFDICNISEMINYVFIYGVDYCNDEVESGLVEGVVENVEEGSVLGVYV